jgi:hypothetical protein
MVNPRAANWLVGQAFAVKKRSRMLDSKTFMISSAPLSPLVMITNADFDSRDATEWQWNPRLSPP